MRSTACSTLRAPIWEGRKPAHQRSRESPARQICEPVADPGYGEGSPMNQSVDCMGRASINGKRAFRSTLLPETVRPS